MNEIAVSGPPRVGAFVRPAGVSYATWAPDHDQLHVLINSGRHQRRLPMRRDAHGFWAAEDRHGQAGDLYRFQFSDGRERPDVVSRFQPQGVHGPSECVDPNRYQWRSTEWQRPRWCGQSIYELHVGTFTAEGTFLAAIETLDHLVELGVDAIEIMPVADFAGDRNWGYDGVALYAPARCYGQPDDLRALVDAAHARGLAVILDVVYNHLGPAGNYLADYSSHYFHADRHTPWGQAFNLGGPASGPVRAFVTDNATYWLDEFRFDGLRLDATHAIPDDSPTHLLDEIIAAIHSRGAFAIAEDERNEARLLQPKEAGGAGLDAAWADDFHHQVRVALTGSRHSYFRGYQGGASDVADTLAHGWTYRGQSYPSWSDRARGTDCGHLPPSSFVVCIENHDQVGNRAEGERLEHLVTRAQFRAASLLLCLSPYAPLLFMGQEWAATSPFQFFTDHGGELGRQVSAGRKKEFAQGGAQWDVAVPDPEALATFTLSKLRWYERLESGHAGVLALYRAALAERRRVLTPAAVIREHWKVEAIDGFVALRYTTTAGTWLLLFALNASELQPTAMPAALEPPRGHHWVVRLHSEDPAFGGNEATQDPLAWKVTGPRAVWLEAQPVEGVDATG